MEVYMKKVLIIAYYFPPLGWSGVQRTLKFVKYLINFGWKPIIVTVGKTKFSVLDETLVKDIPKGIDIIKIDDIKFKDITDDIKKELKSYVKSSFDIISNDDLKREYENEIEKKFSELRDLLLFPDGNSIWANNVIKEISNKINLNEIDVIYSTSAPYSAHLIGNYIKDEYNIPWVADFRDEWNNNPYGISQKVNPIRKKIELSMEKEILHKCNRIVTISTITKDNYIKNFNLDEKKIEIITNGYDESDFEDVYNKKINEKFTIIHNGSFYSFINPYSFIKAINNLIEEKLISISEIEVYFVGKIENEIINKIKKLDINNLVTLVEYMPHIDSLKFANTADLLLLIIGKGEQLKSVYTGKIFEYLRLKKTILSLSPKNSLVEKLLIETKTGKNVEYDDIEEMKKIIFMTFEEWKKNKHLSINPENIKKYSRENLTKRLAEIFNEII
ncbi:glycosyltransferase family 4 protein [Clostridium botulinum]|nr:glycosyltransferase family 4 protein [Clostridium botulinum]NFR89387.1 glycosyltransferase family 4 protein [Clostridium botulinum]